MELDKSLLFLNREFANKEEVFDFMADKLLEKGYVKEAYREKIKERENRFPTGLELKNVNVAIPHTDPEYTSSNQLILVTLKQPVIFKNAVDNEDLNVSMIFGLVFESKETHIDYLMKVSGLLQNDHKLEQISQSNDVGDIQEVLQEVLYE